MPRALSPCSWQVTGAAFITPALACLVLILGFGCAEIAARQEGVQAALYAPSVGSPSRRFELQLHSLERFVADRSRLDCLVVGNSTALMGVDPEALGRGYQSGRGHNLRCFNFGVSGMTASAAGAVTPSLVDRFHPWLLVYVVSARDIGHSVDGPLLASSAWVQYRGGRFSAAGWLAEHSAAYRYYLLYRQWLDRSHWPVACSPSGTTPAGFLPLSGLRPSPALWAHTQQTYADIFKQPPSEEEISGFSRVLDLTGSGTRVVVVEGPAHQQLRRWTRHSTTFYAAAIEQMRQATRQRHVAFWRVPVQRVIPVDGWADFVHLNPQGAARFSEWLGARIARAEQEGRLKPPRANQTPG